MKLTMLRALHVRWERTSISMAVIHLDWMNTMGFTGANLSDQPGNENTPTHNYSHDGFIAY